MSGCKKIKPLLAVHGGAGFIPDKHVPDIIAGMKKSIRCAIPLLTENRSATPALDAVEEAVKIMELNEHFNAGYGASLNLNSKVELDASIMEGAQMRAGCVTLLRDFANPVSVARRIMESTNHTFLGGISAEHFACEQGFEKLEEGALESEKAHSSLTKFKAKLAQGLDQGPGDPGTVGAVAIDAEGNLAVATSTGGLTGKMPGRIGDTPIIGAGSYAENNIGCVSCTGTGETIMRYNLAQRILSLIRYKNMSAQKATETACTEMTKLLRGTGGAITIDGNGDFGKFWTTRRMAWSYAVDDIIYYGVEIDKILNEPL